MNGNTAIQVGIAFTGNSNTAGARSAVLASRSVDGGFTWSAAVALADDDGSLYFNDKESVTIDATDPRFVYAVWDRLEGTDRGPAVMARSTDGGISWSPPTIVYDPGPGGRQTIGNVITVAPDGTVFDFFTELGPAPGNPTQTVGRLAVVRSTDKGVTWSAPAPIADLLSVGTRVRTAPMVAVRAGEILGSFAVDPRNGTLYAVWQDSRFSGGAHDSIVMAWSQDGGSTWSTPAPVNARLDVPAFAPTLAVLPDGTVGIAYYDFRQPGTSTFQPTDFWLRDFSGPEQLARDTAGREFRHEDRTGRERAFRWRLPGPHRIRLDLHCVVRPHEQWRPCESDRRIHRPTRREHGYGGHGSIGLACALAGTSGLDRLRQGQGQRESLSRPGDAPA